MKSINLKQVTTSSFNGATEHWELTVGKEITKYSEFVTLLKVLLSFNETIFVLYESEFRNGNSVLNSKPKLTNISELKEILKKYLQKIEIKYLNRKPSSNFVIDMVDGVIFKNQKKFGSCGKEKIDTFNDTFTSIILDDDFLPGSLVTIIYSDSQKLENSYFEYLGSHLKLLVEDYLDTQ